MFPAKQHIFGGERDGGNDGTTGSHRIEATAVVHPTEHHVSNASRPESTHSSFTVPSSMQPPIRQDSSVPFAAAGCSRLQHHWQRQPQRSNGPVVTEQINKDGNETLGYTDRDVLCEKGGRANQHAGNRVFLRLVQRNKDQYRRLDKKSSKDMLIQSILLSLQQNGGRFLQRNERSGQWQAVSWERSYTKVRQALREPDRTVHKAAILANEMAAARRISAQEEEGVAMHQASLYELHNHHHSTDHSTQVSGYPTAVEPSTRNNPVRMSTWADDKVVQKNQMHEVAPSRYAQALRVASSPNGVTVNNSSNTAASMSPSTLDEECMPPTLQTLLAREDSLFMPRSTEAVWEKGGDRSTTSWSRH